MCIEPVETKLSWTNCGGKLNRHFSEILQHWIRVKQLKQIRTFSLVNNFKMIPNSRKRTTIGIQYFEEATILFFLPSSFWWHGVLGFAMPELACKLPAFPVSWLPMKPVMASHGAICWMLYFLSYLLIDLLWSYLLMDQLLKPLHCSTCAEKECDVSTSLCLYQGDEGPGSTVLWIPADVYGIFLTHLLLYFVAFVLC